jgi:hypothetical protein
MQDEHLADVLSRRKSVPQRESHDDQTSDESLLPDSAHGYMAHSRPANKPLYTLHCILGKEGYRSFQYVHLDSDSRFAVEGKGQVIRLRFSGSKTTAVTIRGRNLMRLFDYVHQHRTAWVMQIEAGRDFAADGETVVTAIEIEEVRDAEPGRSD